MSKGKTYSVSELSGLAGVSKRTLHHYDDIGLLVPPRRKDNGYREYHQKYVILLQQILIYRAIDFSTEDIKRLLGAENYDLVNALKQQKNVLVKRQQDTASMINNLEATMSTVQGKRNSEILFDGIPKAKMDRWRGMIRDRAEDETIEKYTKWKEELTEDKAKALKSEQDEFMDEYAKVMDLPVESEKVQELALQHYIATNRTLYAMHQGFKGISYEGFLIMASEMQNSQLTIELYDHYQKGMAQHLGKAMAYFAENTLKDRLSELRSIGSD